MTEDDDDKPILTTRWAGFLAGLLGVMASLATWVATQVVNLDTRLDRIEAQQGHLVDPDGNARPSPQAYENERNVTRIDAQVQLLREEVDRIWEVINFLPKTPP